MSITEKLRDKSLSSETAFSSHQFEQKVQELTHTLYEKFQACTRFYSRFHIFFIGFAFLQVLSFLLFFSFFSKSAILAFGLALFFLTLFSYFVLIFFFQAKKPQQFLEIREEFATSCKSWLPFEKGTYEYHLPLTNALNYFISELKSREMAFYTSFTAFKATAPLMEKFNIWAHWKNFHSMKELLLLLSIEELVYMVKAMPIDLEAHAALASAYASLSKLYLNPKKLDPNCSMLWLSPEYDAEMMKLKFQACSARAIEEFKILSDYIPEDPWVHAQLADIYHWKGEAEHEIHEYETLLKIAPNDLEVLFHLGVLYFQQGHNSKGLKVYEQIKKGNSKQAEDLIGYYDSFQFYEFAYLSSLSK